MSISELAYETADRLAAIIRRKEVSPVEVVRASLERIEETNGRLNAFCFVHEREALAEARGWEDAVRRGDELPPLAGVPFALKDMTPTKGRRTTMGSRLHEHWVPEKDAIVGERLAAAGAVLVGKTTTPELAHSYFTDSPLWGVTRNPWDRERTPGGSSGGSAAAVASGCVALAEGSDSGGSIRVPAAFCGLVGLKPSFGRIPFEFLPSLYDTTFHVGPITRTVDDAALFLAATQGPDERDPFSLTTTLDLARPLPADVAGLRIAYSRDLGFCAIDAEVAANARRAAAMLAAAGATVEEVELPLGSREDLGWCHWSVYYATLYEEDFRTRREMMDPRFAGWIESGLAVSGTKAKRNEFARSETWRKLAALFSDYDLLLCPTASVPAPAVTATDDDYTGLDEAGRYRGLDLTFHFNMASQLPAMSVPSGMTVGGLPTGIQIVGRRYDEPMVLRAGKVLERAVGWPDWRPPV